MTETVEWREIDLNPGQGAFVNAQFRLRLLSGGRGSGKSAAGAVESVRMIGERPTKPGLIAGPDYPHLVKSTLPEFEAWIPPGHIVDRNKEEKWYQFRNGTRVWYIGLDDPDAPRGMSVNWFWYDEGGMKKTDEAWKVLLATLRIGPDPRGWVTSSPRGKSHWLHDHFVKRADPAMHWVGHASVYENERNLDEGYIKSLEQAYVGAWLRQELFGEFVELGGTTFERVWFDIVEEAPEETRWVRAWDLACSVRQVADFTCGSKIGLADGHIYISDVVKGQWSWPDAKRVIIETAQEDGTDIPIGIEQVAFQLAAIQDLQVAPALVGHWIQGVVPAKDKLSRALGWAAKAKGGLVHLVEGPWTGDWLNEVSDFPLGSKDDQTDSTSLGVQLLGRTDGKIAVLIG